MPPILPISEDPTETFLFRKNLRYWLIFFGGVTILMLLFVTLGLGYGWKTAS